MRKTHLRVAVTRASSLLPVFGLLACGSSQRGPTPPPVSPATSVATSPEEGLDLGRICARFQELSEQQCGQFSKVQVDHGQCGAMFRDALRGNRHIDRAIQATARCLQQRATCDAVLQCISQFDYQNPNDLRECHADNDGRMVAVSTADYERRVGATETHFSEVASSRDRPAEVCGIVASKEWLVTLRCDDGSQPVANLDIASEMRVGNVGAGGRCGSIVDLYRIPCPERTYELYVDGYICPAL